MELAYLINLTATGILIGAGPRQVATEQGLQEAILKDVSPTTRLFLFEVSIYDFS